MVHIGVGIPRPFNMRILDMGTSKSSDGIIESLPALDANSGCNVNVKGKARWLSTAENKEEYLQSVSQLGDAITINADVFQKMEKLFCHLCEMPNETNINETGFKKLCVETMPEPLQLLPTKGELTQHIIHAYYQAHVRKRSSRGQL